MSYGRPIPFEIDQRICAGENCGVPLTYGVDPIIYVRNGHGQDRDYCTICCGDIISDAMDAICAALEPEPDNSVVAMYSWLDAAE